MDTESSESTDSSKQNNREGVDEGNTMKYAFLHNFVLGVGLAIAAIVVFAAFGTLIDTVVKQVELPLLVRVGVGFLVAVLLRVVIDAISNYRENKSN